MPKQETAAAPTSDFSISTSQTADFNPDAQAALDKALSEFASKPAVSGIVSGSVTGTPTAEVDYNSEELTPSLESPTEEEEGEEAEETPGADEDAEETGEPELEGFDAEFSKRFGVKPEEAVETLNSLLAFRDEMSLMRSWSVSPGEYDQRMTAVKEFYNTLPEDKQPEFNSIEGAKAIWEHLSKTTGSKKSTTAKAGGSKKAPAQPSQKNFIKKSEILGMDEATYRRRLPEINKAFFEGRVLENE
jgi:hypothetical protein